MAATAVPAVAGASVSRATAQAKALKALRVGKSRAPLIVFRLRSTVPAGSRIGEAGLAAANASALKQSPAQRKKRLQQRRPSRPSE